MWPRGDTLQVSIATYVLVCMRLRERVVVCVCVGVGGVYMLEGDTTPTFWDLFCFGALVSAHPAMMGDEQ